MSGYNDDEPYDSSAWTYLGAILTCFRRRFGLGLGSVVHRSTTRP